MAARRRRLAEAALSLALIFGPAANANAQVPVPRAVMAASLSDHFNTKANPAAPPYEPQLWNDGDDAKVTAFYASHQPELGKISAKEGRLYVWPLAKLLHRTSNAQLESRYGLTAKEAVDFRKGFDEMTAGVQFRTNCYSYALDHPHGNLPGWKLSPGEISGLGIAEPKDFTPRELSRRVEADGLLPAGKDPKAKEGYYLVALFVRQVPDPDFHFVRQNRDGTWSQKNGDETVTALDFSDDPILDPRKADFGAYKFVDYFYVPQGGLKFDGTKLPPVKPVVHKSIAPKSPSQPH